MILSKVLNEDVPADYGPLLSEVLGIADRSVQLISPPKDAGFVAGIIGVGMSGIAAARALQASGVAYEVLEKNAGVGGV